MQLDKPCNICGCDYWGIDREGNPFCITCTENKLDFIRKKLSKKQNSEKAASKPTSKYSY